MLGLESSARSLEDWLIVWWRELGVEGSGQLGEAASGDVGPRLFSLDSHTVTLGRGMHPLRGRRGSCGGRWTGAYAWKTSIPGVGR